MRKHKGLIIFGAIAALLLIADLLTKHFVAANLSIGEGFTLVPRVMSVFYTINTGMAFGWFAGGRFWLIAISIVMILGVMVFYVWQKRRKKKTPIIFDIAIGFFLAGALGNLVDRIFLGHVRDFIRLDFWPRFPIFNLADVWINVAVVLIVVYLIIDEVQNFRQRRRDKAGHIPQETDGGDVDTLANSERD